jgi:hypothetical protein
MTILFTVPGEVGYFVSRFEGTVSDDEMLEAYREFCEKGAWRPGMNELADLRHADLGRLTGEGLRRVAEYTEQLMRRSGVESSRLAIYAPRGLPHAFAEIYSALTIDSPERVHVFRDLSAAVQWLEEDIA